MSTGVRLHGEETGGSAIHGKVEQIATAIAEQAGPRFAQQGWIPQSERAP